MQPLNIGQTIWLVEAITRKKDRMVVGATVDRFRVISFDEHTVVAVHAWYDSDGRDHPNRDLGDLVGVRFVARGECWLTQEDAERVHKMVVEGRVPVGIAGSRGTEPSPTGETGRTE